MSISKTLLAEIREYLAETGMAATTFGRAAVANTYIVEKLESGRTITVDTADRVRAWMKANPPSTKMSKTRRRAA